VNTAEKEMESLREVSPQASLHVDGGVTCILLPKTQLTVADGVEVMDTLLCTTPVSGYATRLLLERRIQQKTNLNWQTVMLLGRSWHTWSWNFVLGDQPWIKIFAEHARALR
jgi:hypothetical protein